MFEKLGSRAKVWGFAVRCGVSALLGVVLAWGFTVDDALVTARVAWRLANGFGYRFNASGPVVDAVTPLGWVYLLAPFAHASPLTGLFAARCFGAALWVLSAMWCGSAVSRARACSDLTLPLLVAAPLGAWASAGMETGAVLALCTFALADSWYAALAAALAAAWRPELLPFCAIVSARPLNATGNHWATRLARLLCVVSAVMVVALIRRGEFGRALPLAAIAKPSDFGHGLSYSIGALFFLGPIWTWLGPGWNRIDCRSRWLAAAVAVHFVSIAAAGGDWMPLWRLAVPAMPAAFWVSNGLCSVRRSVRQQSGVIVAYAAIVCVSALVGVPARRVVQARERVIQEVRPLLEGSKLTAGLDIGWLGVATRDDIIDLAGITDPRIARIPGGHTSKNIKNAWFDALRPDALVLLVAPGESSANNWWDTRFARVVENSVAHLDYFRGCQKQGQASLMYTSQFYIVVRCQ